MTLYIKFISTLTWPIGNPRSFHTVFYVSITILSTKRCSCRKQC